MRETENIPDTYGIRLDGKADDQGQVTVRLAWAEQPETSDQVVDDNESITVFVDPAIAPELDDLVIDVADDQSQQLVMRKAQ